MTLTLIEEFGTILKPLRRFLNKHRDVSRKSAEGLMCSMRNLGMKRVPFWV